MTEGGSYTPLIADLEHVADNRVPHEDFLEMTRLRL